MKSSPDNARHLCVDMQVMFVETSEWQMPWAEKVLRQVEELAFAYPARTIFTRFMPVRSVEDAIGTWRDYYRKWPQFTLENIQPGLVDLVPSLKAVCPPAVVFDKVVYSPWIDGRLNRYLRDNGVDTLVISGGETDVCVMATVLGAVDLGYSIVLVKDALCSSTDNTHDASLELLAERFSVQVDLADTAAVRAWWR